MGVCIPSLNLSSFISARTTGGSHSLGIGDPMSDTVAVIGGEFYGCVIALELSERHDEVVLLEKADDLMTRASLINQARVHNGYHYPRSIMTAFRSFANFPRFVAEYRDVVDRSFEKVYARRLLLADGFY